MSQTTDIHKSVFQSLVNFFNSYIKDVEINYTRYGTVIQVLGNNQYTVKINNLPYTINAPSKPSALYVVGDIVMIEIVNNDFSHKYIKCLKPY